jgi:hypothetical protein
MPMKRLVLTVVLVLGAAAPAFATWSVIAIDVKTGQVIIASSTCVRQAGFPERKPNGARDLMDVQAVIVPGIGVAACQAGVDNTRENQMLVYNEIRKGTPPADIIEMLKKDPNIERRQFGIVSIPNGKTITPQNNRAGFNGSGNSRSSLYFGGQYGDYYYQVQGNTLLGDQVVYQAALAFTRAKGTLADHVIDKDDQAGVTHNDGKYFAYIAVGDNDLKKGESANPVKTLRMRYNAWVKAGARRTDPPGPTLYKPGATTSQQ